MGARLLIFFVTSWLLSHCVWADPQTDFKIPKPLMMGFKHHSYEGAAIENSEARLSMDYTQVLLPIGKFNAGDHTLVPSLSLEQSQFKVRNSPNSAGDPVLYTVKSQFLFIKKINEQWMRIIQVTPSLHTDGKALDEEAYSLMGLAIWKYTSSDVSGWTIGFGANRLFGEYKPIPLVAYQYKLSEYSQLDVGFPVTKYEHQFNDRWTSFAAIKPVGGNWRFEDSNNNRVNVAYSSWVASIGARYNVKDNVWATLEAGQGLSRKFDIDTDDLNQEADIDNSNTIMFSIGLHP